MVKSDKSICVLFELTYTPRRLSPAACPSCLLACHYSEMTAYYAQKGGIFYQIFGANFCQKKKGHKAQKRLVMNLIEFVL